MAHRERAGILPVWGAYVASTVAVGMASWSIWLYPERVRAETERLRAQERLADSTRQAAEASEKLAKALGVLHEDKLHNAQAEELKRVLDEFNARNKKK